MQERTITAAFPALRVQLIRETSTAFERVEALLALRGRNLGPVPRQRACNTFRKGELRRLILAALAGDSWLKTGDNLLVLGPLGRGKSHLAAAIGLGLGLIEIGWRVLFARTTDLVQRLQVARCEIALESAIAKLDKHHLLILDDLAYVT